jgi:hypothetical protein
MKLVWIAAWADGSRWELLRDGRYFGRVVTFRQAVDAGHVYRKRKGPQRWKYRGFDTLAAGARWLEQRAKAPAR